MKFFGIEVQEMLEVRVNQAHLMGSRIVSAPPSGMLRCSSILSLFRDFVRDLFTISAAFIEISELRPVRSIRPERAGAAPCRGCEKRRRGRRRRGCGSQHLAGRGSTGRTRRGVRTL